MLKAKSILISLCAVLAVLFFAATIDAAKGGGGCKDRDNDGYFQKEGCGSAVDCDDSDASVNPGAAELCDGIDNNCDGTIDEGCGGCTDNDGDGYGNGPDCLGPDCDDNDASINPGATEVCGNGIDENCDGQDDLCPGCTDNDGDGYGVGTDCLGPDCDDTDPSINPGAAEVCDDVDNNCDGTVDEGCAGCTPTANKERGCDCFDNTDNDCDGAIDSLDRDCKRETCDTCFDDDGDGWYTCGGDCDDTDPAINPGATEVCNGFDDDCDGLFPIEEQDADGDGWMICDGDCDDTDPLINPGASEVCNGFDDNCDGVLPPDEVDFDGDGFMSCEDCNDRTPNAYPKASEAFYGHLFCCDTVDNDCDGQIDESDPDCQDGGGQAAVCEFKIIDLWTLGGTYSYAYGINDNGQVVGLSETVSGDTHAFLYENGTMTDLGTISSIGTTEAHDINNIGQIVGFSGAQAFLYENGTMTDIGALIAPVGGSSAYGINDNSQIVGQEFFTGNGFLYENGSTTNLGNLGGVIGSSAEDININGQIAGFSSLPNGEWHAFLYESGVMTDLGTLGGTDSYAWSINDIGQIVGISRDAGNEFQAFLYEGGSMTNLSILTGTAWSAFDINNRSQIVGSCSGHACIYENGTLKDLRPDSGLNASSADAINNNGLIVGYNAGRAAMWAFDKDNDTYYAHEDCDDYDPFVYPGDTEGPFGDPTCTDGIDNDCDDLIDPNDPDCAPCNPTGLSEAICNGVDDDCDDLIDEDYIPTPTTCGVGECGSTGQLECQGGIIIDTCVALPPGIEGPAGDPTCSDGLDNDCDGQTDPESDCFSDQVDNDGDGFCEGPTCTDGSTPGDCDDMNPDIHPNAIEDCFDGIDNDCDNFYDALDTDAVYTCTDSDSDGYAIEGSCCGPVDCDDADPGVNPGAAEVCSNTKDDDCNGLVNDIERWGTELMIEASSENINSNPNVAVDDNNNAIAVWSQGVFGDNRIWSNRYTTGSGWETPVQIETGTGVASAPDIAIDGNGNAIVVWIKGTGKDVWASRYTAGSGWGAAELIEQSTGEAEAPRIAIDGSGNAVVVWSQFDATEYNIWTNTYTAGAGWSSPQMMDQINNASVVKQPDIAMSSDGNAIIVWGEYIIQGDEHKALTRHYTPGSGWSATERIDNGGICVPNPSIAMNDSGDAVASWPCNDPAVGYNGVKLMTANRYTAGSGWGTAELIETNNSSYSQGHRVAISPNGNAVVVWQKHNGGIVDYDLWANEFTVGSGWGTPQLLEQNPNSAYISSDIAMDGAGNAVVLWRDGGIIDNLFASTLTSGSGWEPPKLIETEEGLAQPGNIALSSGGFGMAVWKAFRDLGPTDRRYNVWARTYNASAIQGTEGPAGDPTCSDLFDNDCDGLTDNLDAGCM